MLGMPIVLAVILLPALVGPQTMGLPAFSVTISEWLAIVVVVSTLAALATAALRSLRARYS
jgi:hypothetical protein